MFVLDVRVCHSEEFSDEVAARDVVPPRPRARESPGGGPDKILFQLSLLSSVSLLLVAKISSFILLVTGPADFMRKKSTNNSVVNFCLLLKHFQNN